MVLGLITLLGFFATLLRLQEIEGRAVDYATLHERVTKIIENELKDAHNSKRFVWIMANSPTFGNLSDRTSFSGFQKTLMKAVEDKYLGVQVLCLDWTNICANHQRTWVYPSETVNDHVPKPPNEHYKSINCDQIETPLAKFYREVAGYVGKKDIGSLALTEALNILQSIHHIHKAQSQKQKEIAKKGTFALGKEDERPTRVPLHFVLTSRAAIVFNTLDLPNTDGNGHVKDDEVHVAAFESTDGSLRKKLKEAFAFHTARSTEISAS
jgi:hypothetical protein